MATRSSVAVTFHLVLTCALLLRAAGAEGADAEPTSSTLDGRADRRPHVFVAVLARNTAHTLADFLGYFEQLDYPKQRISVW